MSQPTRKIKLSRKIKTIDDLISRSDVNDILSNIASQKVDITDIVCIYKTSDGFIQYSYAINEPNTTGEVIKVLGLIEYAKNILLNPNDKSEEE